MSNTYKNILVAVDGSETSKKALYKAIRIAKNEGAAIHLIHVVEQYPYPGDTGALRREAERLAHAFLKDFKEIANSNGVTQVETIFEFGHPRSLISKKHARLVEADLIVCGATGANFIQQLIGSVSEYIVRTAKCDVLVVR